MRNVFFGHDYQIQEHKGYILKGQLLEHCILRYFDIGDILTRDCNCRTSEQLNDSFAIIYYHCISIFAMKIVKRSNLILRLFHKTLLMDLFNNNINLITDREEDLITTLSDCLRHLFTRKRHFHNITVGIQQMNF